MTYREEGPQLLLRYSGYTTRILTDEKQELIIHKVHRKAGDAAQIYYSCTDAASGMPYSVAVGFSNNLRISDEDGTYDARAVAVQDKFGNISRHVGLHDRFYECRKEIHRLMRILVILWVVSFAMLFVNPYVAVVVAVLAAVFHWLVMREEAQLSELINYWDEA